MPKKLSAYASVTTLAAIVTIGLVMIGCGSSSSNSLTQAQAQQVASAISTGISQSVAAAFGAADLKPGHGVAGIEAPDPRSSTFTCTTTPTGESCSATVSTTYSCTAGGTIGISGNVSGNISSSGSGSISEQITATPASCVVDGLTLNGDPSISVAGQINVANDQPVFPITGSETGGVSFGPKPSGMCTFNVNFSVSSSLACTITGTACGRTVSGSC